MPGRFLVVEDDPPLARSIARELGRHRPADIAHTLEQARECLARHGDWTGFVFDLVLPDGYGLDLLEEIRPRFSQVPVLILTGELRPDVVNRVQVLRAEYVCKPADPDNLRSFVRYALAQEAVEDTNIARRIEALIESHNLTRREADVLAHAIEHRTRRDLASALGVTENTVKAQIRSLLRKTGARTLALLVQDVFKG